MKFGKLEIKGYNKMYFNGQHMNPLHTIIWRMIWAIPYYIAVGIIYISVLVTNGKYAADTAIGQL